ncbi:hypothetical protein LTR09_010968 [Extremus antarcticus]|uniref:Uncharacterized protein n=1 Tax=Extremus antarcticus TaxID=702011 RepID=A0AAJ0D6R9_9PEZI|nr:hypothetical protein LTR09_010968 [Extremus antarcticus]
MLRRRCPDATFYHPEQPHLPSLVLEVAYSQTYEELEKLAISYITDSQGAIKCVVGLNLPFPLQSGAARSTATLHIWRPTALGLVTRTDYPFDFSSGTLHAFGAPVRLFAHDLLPTTVAGKISTVALDIAITTLASIVRSVADRARDISLSPKPIRTSPPSFRKRTSSPARRSARRRTKELSPKPKSSPPRCRLTDFYRVQKRLQTCGGVMKVEGWS